MGTTNKTEFTDIYLHISTIEIREARFLRSCHFITESKDMKIYLFTEM